MTRAVIVSHSVPSDHIVPRSSFFFRYSLIIAEIMFFPTKRLAMVRTLARKVSNRVINCLLYMATYLLPSRREIVYENFSLCNRKGGLPEVRFTRRFPFIVSWVPAMERSTTEKRIESSANCGLSCYPYVSETSKRKYMRLVKRGAPGQGGRCRFPPILLGVFRLGDREEDVTDALRAVLGPEGDLHNTCLTVRELYYVFREMLGLPKVPCHSLTLTVLTAGPDFASVVYRSGDSFVYPAKQ